MTATGVRVLVLAKEPLPGRVKTRLCPPCTPVQAARVAVAALADTLDTVDAAAAGDRCLVVDGRYPVPSGWAVVTQRGGPLSERLANAFADTAVPGRGTLLIGMDTPQLSVGGLDDALRSLDGADAVLGPAADGGWWALGLRDPGHAAVLRDIPTSTADTGEQTLTALRRQGLRVALLPELRDVDTAADAHAAAAACPAGGRFARTVATEVPPARTVAAQDPPARTAGTEVPRVGVATPW